MKLKLYTLFALIGGLVSSHAAVSVTGTGATGLNSNAGTALAAGSLAIWIADVDGNGFGSLTNQTISVGSSLALGSTFGGDLIVGRVSTTVFTSLGRSAAGWSYDNPAVVNSVPDLAPGTKFALVWFSTSTGSVAAATTDTAAGMFYGVATWDTPAAGDGDWVIGSQTSGSIGFSTGTISTANPFKSLVAADFTNGNTPALNNANAMFSVVPEPSAALLGMLGALGLLRRRR